MRAWDFHPDVGLVLAGGVEGGSMIQIDGVEISEDYGITFRELAPLPKTIYVGCAVIVNESTVYHIGGFSSNISSGLMYVFMCSHVS